jgi:hypothetical protein
VGIVGDQPGAAAVRAAGKETRPVQGVIKSYDPNTRDGVVMSERDFTEYDLSPDALDGSVFRMLRQGQRVIFELDADGLATGLHLGSEVDMGTPDFLR